jgi:hypothetical protein
MTPRSLRRALERKAQKQARKEALQIDQPDTPAPQIKEISAAQLAANRQNALLSTGPKSAASKAKASLNAVKTGLTGRTVLLPTDDAVIYEQHLRRFFEAWNPATERETELVQRLADSQWRLYRIPEIEAGIYALAHIEFAEMFADYESAEAAALIQAHAFRVHQKQLNNLSIQEARLHRQFAKDRAELREIQETRRRDEQQRQSAKRSQPAAAAKPAAAVQPENGFEFSTAQTRIAPPSPHSQLEPHTLTKAA